MIVLCLGLPGSASTLAFNLVREILAGQPGARVTALEATTLDTLEAALTDAPTGRLAIRAHTASHALLSLLDAASAPVLLTVRDPRDSVASLCLRLGGTAVNWATDVARSLAAIATVQARRGLDAIDFAASAAVPDLAQQLGERLGLPIGRDLATRIAAGWIRPAVTERLHRLRREASPSELGWRSDPLTGLNEAHLGDGRPGKWCTALSGADAARVDAAFGGLGPVTVAARPGRLIRFAEPLFGTAARPPQIANLEPDSPIGLRLLCLCYLGIGQWRVGLRGSLPAGHLPARLHLAVGGVVRWSLDLPAAAPGQGAVALPSGLGVAFEHRNHEHQMELLLEGPGTTLPDPFRPDAVTLEAVLEAP